MKIDFEQLLTPISDEAPCGRDISDETDFYILEEMAKGKQETQFSEAEPPDWNEILDLALTLFNQSKDLWIAYYIICSAVNLYGDEGMAKGFEFLQALLEKFWDSLTPKLDKDSDMPSFQRINVVKDVFILQGPFVAGVKNIMLAKSGIGSFNYNDILASGSDQAVTEDVILAAINDSDKEFLAGLRSNFKKTQEVTKTLKIFLQDKGVNREFEEAFEAFSSMIDSIEKYIDVNTATAQDKQNQEVPTKLKGGMPDQISNYQDIIKMLKKICNWYEENEPSSPVPLFLARAESLIGKNFTDIINDVASSAMKEVSVLFKLENKYETGNVAGPTTNPQSPR